MSTLAMGSAVSGVVTFNEVFLVEIVPVVVHGEVRVAVLGGLRQVRELIFVRVVVVDGQASLNRLLAASNKFDSG